jgi:hypothetical protein
MSNFEEMCESFGVMKTVKRERYPREIRLSEEFLEALKKEFYNHKLEEDAEKPIRNYPEKFSKALRFEISHLNDRADIELEAMRQRFADESEVSEANNERVPEVTVDGKKKELPQNEAPKNTPPKEEKLCKCKRLVLKRNTKVEEKSKTNDCDGYKLRNRERGIGKSMPRKSKHKIERWTTHQEVKDKKSRNKWSK